MFIVSFFFFTFCWDSEVIETPTPSKKKRAYVIVVASSVRVLINLDILVRLANVTAPHLPIHKLIKTFLAFRSRMSC